MAKNRSDEATTATTEGEAQVQGTESAATEATAAVAAGADDRFKKIKHPETGAEVNRKDYILDLWVNRKMSRGAIAKHLTELTGKKVAYQIVFATTKGKAGGPDKPVEGAAPAAAGEGQTA